MNKKDKMALKQEILADVAAALTGGTKQGQKQATTHTAITLHDGGGIFSTCGLEREVIGAYVQPHGIGSALRLLPSVDTDPRFASITGFTAATGTQPTNTCDDAPYGYMKGCELTATFGRIRYDTNTIEFDKVMQRYNRGDFTDLALMGSIMAGDEANQGMMPAGLDQGQILNVITMAEMVTAGVLGQRELVRQMWQGNVQIDREFPGLDSQIATGQLDASTGTACPALDSDVKDFAYADVCGTTRDIVEYMSMMAWMLSFNARRMKVEPVKCAIAVRPELWYELSACWPCRYLTNRCQDAAGTQVAVINDENNTKLRDRIRDNMQLPIHGIWYDVIVDDGIFEHNSTNNANLAAGEFASSIYFVPVTILGNFPATYRQYLNYKHPLADQNVRMLRGMEHFWTDNGIFSWAIDIEKWCYKLCLKTEQRVVLRTPQLAGKIQHVKYTPLQHLRSPFPSSPYFAGGGVSIRPIAKKYAVWAPAGGIGRDR